MLRPSTLQVPLYRDRDLPYYLVLFVKRLEVDVGQHWVLE